MRVSTSAYYRWKKQPGQLISAEVLHLHRRMRALFKQSRNSLGSRGMMKKLREEGIQAGRYKVRNLRSEEHTSELQSRRNLVCRLLLEKKKKPKKSKKR